MSDSDRQQRVFAFLSGVGRGSNVRRIDTHAAAVFLQGDRALKIKRAVRFPFLDYSTLAKRKAACEQELTVNRPFAPEIYRRVVPITERADGSLDIDGGGAPVEYAVEMARFDESRTLDLLAAEAPPGADLIEALAAAVAVSHDAAAPARDARWVESILPIIADNTTELQDSGRLSAAGIDRLDQASRSAFARVRNLLHRRARDGFVRRCHGDLHLANVVLIAGKPVLFDAIEFDPLIATTDVLYDLAFPVMDLVRYGRHAAANVLLNEYLRRSGGDHPYALALLPLFLSLRAAIRTKVLLARVAHQPQLMAPVRSYFDVALRAIDPPSPLLIAVGGLSGTGKSVLARDLAPGIGALPGAVILRTDVIRKQLLGVKETERLPDDAYRPEVNRRIYETMAQQAGRILSQGHSVVADAVFAEEWERAAVADVARQSNVRFAGVFLQADLATRLRRVGQRARDASDATPAIAQRQDSYDVGKLDWMEVDATGTPAQTLALCRARIVVREPA